MDSIITFTSIATISLLILSLSFKPLVVVSWLADCLSVVYTPQSNPIQES